MRCYSVVRDCPGRFPVHVVGRRGAANPHLTVYANKAGETLSARSVPVYLGEVLKLFSWAEADPILQEERQSLLGPASEVRRIVQEYLVADCRCVIRRRQDTDSTETVIVRTTNETRVNVKMTLHAMKHFYDVLASCDLYPKPNPLTSEERVKALATDIEVRQRAFFAEHGRASPSNSGGVDDSWRNQLRYSTNYFQLADGQWKPQVISEPRLPTLVYKAGESFGWTLRDHVIARILFESGGRIGDAVCRNFADWLLHDCLGRMESDSKGSHGRRVKTLVFGTETATMLRRYFNTERAAAERGPFRRLGDLQKAVRNGRLDPKTVPIFLTSRGKPYSCNSFRDDRWRPAMAAAGIKCQPHQTRHWFVTTSLTEIDETAKSEAERARRRNELVKYMKWKSGDEMLKTYDHTGVRAAAAVRAVHDKMRDLESQHRRHSLEVLKRQSTQGLSDASEDRSEELEDIFALVDGEGDGARVDG